MGNKLIYFTLPALLLLSACDLENFISPDYEAKVFNVSFPSGTFTAATQEFSVAVECDIRWAAGFTSGKWASITNASEEGIVSSPLMIHLSSNRSNESRTDTLVVTAGSVVKAFPIVQEAITSIISSKEVELKGTAPVKVTINALEKWSSEVLDKAEWLEINPVSGAPGIVDVTVRAKENNIDVVSRNASVRFTIGSDMVGLSVIQIQTDTIGVAVDTVSLGWEGEVFEIQTESNVEYEVSSDVEWINHVPATRALNEASESFEAARNGTSESREGTILFRYGSLESRVKVIQEGMDPFLMIVEEGLYSYGGEDFIRGKSQISRLSDFNSGLFVFRILDPLTLTVTEIADIPKTPVEGETYDLKLTRYSFGNEPVSSLLTMINLYSDDVHAWFRSSEGAGLIVKK